MNVPRRHFLRLLGSGVVASAGWTSGCSDGRDTSDRVIVIGAGASGLTAACILNHEGVDWRSAPFFGFDTGRHVAARCDERAAG